MGVRFFEDANALDSLRSSDFDALSAYGEVIDNAIQAGADCVTVDFETTTSGKWVGIERLVFGDNGSGMDANTLASCLKLGWSSRFNDRKGIGRFGVGMVLGAIHEVKRVTVISKTSGSSDWLSTYVDLDEVAKGVLEEIPAPIKTELPKRYKDRVGLDSGTLVIWEKYDRQKQGADKIRSEAHHYFGRTFRKFIWGGLRILIDGKTVKAHDPLYVTTDKTLYPDDPAAKAFPPIVISWPIKDPELRAEFGDESKVTIQLSLLPEEFRPKQGSGGSPFAKERRIDEFQQGISILREGREVFFGQVPYWSSVKVLDKSPSWKFEEIDRWWGCEISFGAELDSSFEVKNIKRGARPEAELLQLIKEKITPTRKSVLEQVREVWVKAKREEEEAISGTDDVLGRHGGHSEAEKAAEKGTTLGSKYNPDEPVQKVADQIQKNNIGHMEAARQQRYIELFKAQPYVIADDMWKGPTFWEVTHGGGKIFMNYNTRHEFFVELRTLEDLIVEETDPEQLRILTKRITALVDLLLISYAKAEANHEPDSTVKVSDFSESMNTTWGQCLKSFVKAWTDDGGKNDG
ncbi:MULTISPECIES: ATP-binding protein [Nitrincola]|uniref:DNA mismatch repair protein MutL n=1 Tax=Nitrincola nitratireducens TaxID=1229521 RepID=W9V387_9GAMM|nr:MULTISPECIES: ATP-binding protein [Nitrincola]EXJ11391.1 DNA mismatch repair protein MutL [Nitrincola nitratireducens]